MNLFLKKTFIFLILLVLLNLIIFLLTNYLYNNKYISNVSILDKSVFLLSDSHGHSLGKFTETYNVKNLATQSDSYADMYRKLKYINNRTKVKRIYLSVGGRLFSEYRDVKNNSERSIFLLSYADYDNTLEFLIEQYVKRFLIYPTSEQHTVFVSVLLSKLKIGKVWVKTKWNDLNPSERVLQASKRVNDFNLDTKSDIQNQCFKKIIKFCKNNNIELILVQIPLSKEFMNDPNFSIYDYSEIPEMKELKILDYTKIYWNKPFFFEDQDHLNEKGAEEFCKLLFANEL
jgi:hypothetical protein